MGLFLVYVPALVSLGMGVFGQRDLWILRRRGVPAEGRRGGTSWNASIPSIDVVYRDEAGERHYVTMAAEDLGLVGDESVVRIVYDPLKPDRATTEKVLKKPLWRTSEAYFMIVGLLMAAVVTVALAASS